MKKTLRILGTRGIPAQHGGFETFAEKLAVYLVSKGWKVVVYCQEDGEGPLREDEWCGIDRVIIPESLKGAVGTIRFDWRATTHASHHTDGIVLLLGYNTAVFCLLLRLKGIQTIINMDGIEWKRDKWGKVAKTWFWLNERFGCWLGHHLIADHPEIKKHLAGRVRDQKITMIPYGAECVSSADINVLSEYGLQPHKYAIVIARPEPENSILQIVRSFSQQKRGMNLVVLGRYDTSNSYHVEVLNSASDEVIFLGAIYDKQKLNALRFHSAFYIHGHTVGGTNPSLVEALGAGQSILAHKNKFNEWVLGSQQLYFFDEQDADIKIGHLVSDPDRRAVQSLASKERYTEVFTWSIILSAYEELLMAYAKRKVR